MAMCTNQLSLLASKGTPYSHRRFLDLVIEEFKAKVDPTEGKNQGLNEDVILQFLGSAIVGAVEWWFKNGVPLPACVMAE